MFPQLIEMIVNSNIEDLEKSCVTLRSTEFWTLKLQNRFTQNDVTFELETGKFSKKLFF